MGKAAQPDAVTKAACRWLLSGAIKGDYSGPDPGESHGLTSLLAEETGRTEISLAGAAMWLRLEQTLKPVLQKLDAAGITVWAVKGFDLARTVYPFPGGRPMCDADLFVKEENRRRTLSIFFENGWRKTSHGDGIFTSGLISEIKMIKHGVMAELHTHIFYFPATFPGRLPADLFLNARPIGPGLSGFAWHNALLLVIIHLLTNKTVRPVWWTDICLLCLKVTEAQSWDKFTVNAFRTDLGAAVATVLSEVRDELSAPVPEDTIQSLKNCGEARGTILIKLRRGNKIPTILNLRYLTGWKRISWIAALFQLVVSGIRPVTHHISKE